jgi:hypothetical protein
MTRIVRLCAWGVVLAALCLVVAAYEHLPATLPVTRWTTAPRSPLIALRIPAINLLMLVLIEILRRVLARSPHGDRWIGVLTPLYAAGAAKAAIEAGALMAWPATSVRSVIALLFVVAGGLAWAARRALPLRATDWRRDLRLTAAEQASIAAVVLAIVALQLAPLAG